MGCANSTSNNQIRSPKSKLNSHTYLSRSPQKKQSRSPKKDKNLSKSPQKNKGSNELQGSDRAKSLSSITKTARSPRKYEESKEASTYNHRSSQANFKNRYKKAGLNVQEVQNEDDYEKDIVKGSQKRVRKTKRKNTQGSAIMAQLFKIYAN